MDDKKLVSELNKILTLEHGHLGMYKNFNEFEDQEIRRTFRRFYEIEVEHIEKLRGIMHNLGAKPRLLIEGGDILGNLFGITLNTAAGPKETIKVYSAIEKKSHEGYSDFVSNLEQDPEPRNRYLAEIVVSNMVESQLMHLWLENQLVKMQSPSF